MITVNCELNGLEDKVYPVDQGQWDDLTDTWDDWTTWYFDSPTTINWLSELFILGPSRDFNLQIETVANGLVEYEVYTSDTGAFTGEETTTVIAQGETDVPGFTGKYFRVAVKLTKTSQTVQTINAVQITTNRESINEIITNVDTSSLSGLITSREVPITRRYSKINSIDVSVQQVTAYNLDLYVSNYPTSTTVIPRVVSKDRTTPTIALIGIDGSNKDATVDIEINGLPEQYMQGNNLYSR